VNHQGRLKRLRADLVTHRLDALLVTHLPNVRYLCGFTGSSAALVVTEHVAVLFTDGRYRTQARSEIKGAKAAIVPLAPVAAAGEWLRFNRKSFARGRRTLGIEGDHLSVSEQARLCQALSSTFRPKTVLPLVEQMRMLKDQSELSVMRSAADLGASLFDVTLRTIEPGLPEVEVAAAMEFEARRRGADAMSFETIIASGPRSSLPHGRASQQRLPRNGFVVCDFGVILRGYCSDRTRTVHVGRASRAARAFYSAVLEAQLAAIDAVRPGVTCDEVDHAARKLLKRSKLAQYFTHSTGHGVGIEIHEPPRVAAQQQKVLEPGMVITIEPGAYLPGQWGVRIEDMVVVTETGCQILAPGPKELIEI
jgi:Xaa-Pro aminopeptidase